MANYNENQINSNETERIIAEKQRINNEDKRQTNETEREASEVTRQTNETEREAREATRQSNESTRITEYNTFMADVHNAEDERIANEEGRVEAEASRVTAENSRIEAENVRAEFYEGFNDRLDAVDSQLAHIENIKTVQDLKNMSLKLDTVIQTCGYYEANDGGANTYIVIPSKEYSYDIECKEYAIRPVATSDTVCPKQFGTVNDGVNGDNEWLQACFDFVRDYNIGVIDGRNLLYTTDSSTTTYHDHYGVVIHQPVTLRNYRGQVKDDVGHLTSIIDMLEVENDFREYLIENCEFNGKYGTVAQSTLGMEDGGRHCICFYGERGKFPKEYLLIGNITIRNCRFIKPDAYGIFMSPADCIYTVENCTFDTNGPCVLSYVTTMIAKNCNAIINGSYKTMVNNFLHDEMEMGSNYQGAKLKSIYVDNCHVTGNGNLVKSQNAPQGSMCYDKIIINNSSTVASSSAGGSCLELHQTYTEKPTTINYVEVSNSVGRVYLNGFTANKVVINNMKNRVTLGSIIDTLIINNFTFSTNSTIRIATGGMVNNFYLNNSKTLESLDPYFDGIGCADTTDGKDKIINLYINDLVVNCKERVIEIGIENIYCENIHVLPTTTAFDLITNTHSQGCKKCIVKNSIFEVTTGDYRYFLNNENASTGNIIFINCVYTTKLKNNLNGMTIKNINVVDLSANA